MEPRDDFRDFRDYCNGWIAARAELSGEAVRVVRVEDGRLIDEDGRAFDDMLAGYGTQAFGHRNAHVARAVSAFLDSDAPSFFTSSVSPWAGRLGRTLCARTGYDRAFFASGGAEAVEAALKLARAATGRPRLLCVEGAWHGCTTGSTAMMPPGVYRDAFGPHLASVETLPFGDVAALEGAIGPDVAALMVEPIQVEAGMRALPDAWLAAACALTARHGVLLIADEVQTGLGRLGRMLQSEAWPRRPDVVVLAKALGGGLVPISCMLSRAGDFERAYGSFRMAEAHNTTFGGNALCCVAALAALELLDEALLARVTAVGSRFRQALAEALDGLALVREVRGEGLLAGIELHSVDHPWLSFESLGLPELQGEPAIGFVLCHRLARAGFVTSVCGHAWDTVRVQPPLNMAEDRLVGFVTACRRELLGLEALL